MSYTVLARKWRPRNFSQLAGQEHVRQALANALDGNRLHHAFLFSGTRGVGKTTIARILAKCLNCEKGVSSEPCGECANCREIDEGRFVDLIEVDAASRTKVDDTRELLDNVQYRPTRGEYKVYLIDEVHMLSKHSFNALLKTLEEPPEHVKFLLATTDPQKLPVTVLSRCLQFNLKKLPVDLIAERLRSICKSEEVKAEEAGLARLARAAAGSMRDGLSLLDQAIAFGGGQISDSDVATMLGSIDNQDIAGLLQSIIGGDAAGAMSLVADMDEHAPDYESALTDMAALVQRAALARAVPDAIDDSRGDRQQVCALAESTDDETLQLLYQIALIGRRDLYLAADARGGFEMVVLRMLAFRPAGHIEAPVAPPVAQPKQKPKPAKSKTRSGSGTRNRSTQQDRVRSEPPKASRQQQPAQPATNVQGRAEPVAAADSTVSQPAAKEADGDWPGMVDRLQLKGAVRELAVNCQLDRIDGSVWHLVLDERHGHLLTDKLRMRMKDSLAELLGAATDLRIRRGTPVADTPAVLQKKSDDNRLDEARQAIDNDPNVQALREVFDARVVDDTVEPVDSDDNTNQDLF